MTSSGAAENFFLKGRALRANAGVLNINANCQHCGEVIHWDPDRMQWCLLDVFSQNYAICRVRYERDQSWAEIPTLVHEANGDLPPKGGSVDDVERWLES